MIPSVATSESAQADARSLADLLHEMSGDLAMVEAAIGRIASPPAGYVRELVEYVRGFGGKRLRPALVMISGRAIDPGAVGETHARVGAVVELIHTATLVHDDILDGSLLRRNHKTLHELEGQEVAVLLFGKTLRFEVTGKVVLYGEVASVSFGKADTHARAVSLQ